jgi:hypothetical protein
MECNLGFLGTIGIHNAETNMGEAVSVQERKAGVVVWVRALVNLQLFVVPLANHVRVAMQYG